MLDPMIRVTRPSLFTVLLGLAGCVSAPFDMYRVAATRAPNDLACPSGEVAQYHHYGQGSHSGGRYAFHGRGRWVGYRCVWSDPGGALCTPEADGVEVGGRLVYEVNR
jgi:hypothetical protein